MQGVAEQVFITRFRCKIWSFLKNVLDMKTKNTSVSKDKNRRKKVVFVHD